MGHRRRCRPGLRHGRSGRQSAHASAVTCRPWVASQPHRVRRHRDPRRRRRRSRPSPAGSSRIPTTRPTAPSAPTPTRAHAARGPTTTPMVTCSRRSTTRCRPGTRTARPRTTCSRPASRPSRAPTTCASTAPTVKAAAGGLRQVHLLEQRLAGPQHACLRRQLRQRHLGQERSATAACTSFGSLIPGNDIHRGMHAFDSANDFWSWMPHACWDRDCACRQAIINWTATSVDGTYYSLTNNDVHLAADDPNAPHTVVHELTHSTMDDAFDDDYPPLPELQPALHPVGQPRQDARGPRDSPSGCRPRSTTTRTTAGRAAPSSTSRRPTWGTAGWGTGDDVEGRVAGALIDITDAANEAYWDRWDESDPGPVWDTFQSYVLDTFPVYVFARAVDGYDDLQRGSARRASTRTRSTTASVTRSHRNAALRAPGTRRRTRTTSTSTRRSRTGLRSRSARRPAPTTTCRSTTTSRRARC